MKTCSLVLLLFIVALACNGRRVQSRVEDLATNLAVQSSSPSKFSDVEAALQVNDASTVRSPSKVLHEFKAVVMHLFAHQPLASFTLSASRPICNSHPKACERAKIYANSPVTLTPVNRGPGLPFEHSNVLTEKTHLHDRVSHTDVSLVAENDVFVKMDYKGTNKTFIGTHAESSAQPINDEKIGRSETKTAASSLAYLVAAKVSARIALAFRRRVSPPVSKADESSAEKRFNLDLSLLVCIAVWYIGSYNYNVTTKLALNAGATEFPFTIATVQFGIGALYALFLWVAPDARSTPAITFQDYLATFPVAACSAIAMSALIVAFSTASISFIQVVRSTEPAFAAVVGSMFYGVSLSLGKWFCLVPVIGGLVMASISELTFTWSALIMASLGNALAAVRSNANKKLMSTPGISDRMGSVGNLFAVQAVNSFLCCIPLMIVTEGREFGAFLSLCKTSSALRNNLLFSGLWRYLFMELSTIVIKKTGAVTQSVLNSLRAALIIVAAAHILGESMSVWKLLACGVTIGGVFLYSIIDRIWR